MTTYFTKNPLGSTSPYDLFDNAQNFDIAVNSITKSIWMDRFGKERKTYWGMEQQFSAQLLNQEWRFNQFIQNSGYQVIGDYVDGPLTLTEYNQLIRYGNELWKLTAATELPYTTSGSTNETWTATDAKHFVSVGDAALRQNLASDQDGAGASLVMTLSGKTVQKVLTEMDDRYDALISPGASSTINTVNGTLGDHSLGFDENAAMYTKGEKSPDSFRLDGFSLRGGVFEGVKIITVGDGGDFTSLNSAIEFASLFRPKYVNSPGYTHNRIEIEIQSGHIITEQVIARQIDLSHITLTSVDDIVKVNVPTDLWWMYGEFSAHLPIIGTIFDLQHIGYDGLSLKMGSQAIVEYGHSRNGKQETKYAGIINAARHNVFINTGCSFVGRECVFTGASEAGVHFEKHSTGCVRDADISGCTLFGIRLINSSTVDCYGVNVSNTISGPGIQAEGGSVASGFGIIASNCKQGLRASFGSKIIATGSTFNNMGASDAWAYASDGSDIVMTTATGTGGACACLAANGSRIDIQGVDASLSGSASGNMRCLSGSTLAATGTTGTFNKAVNTVDGNGIIFK